MGLTEVVDLAGLRRSYESSPFDVADTDEDPIRQFERWFAEVAGVESIEPNAAVLATADARGRPSARHVLVKGVDAAGFRFFTNYGSRKAIQLNDNPHAALAFTWSAAHRQVCVEGVVERLGDAESDDYYRSRPLGSRIGAWASPQSEILADRAELDRRVAEVARNAPPDGPPRPDFWGGYVLAPDRIEFWQGRASRLHDRIVYLPADDREGGGWRRERLAP